MPFRDWREESRTLSTRAFEKPIDPQTHCGLIQLPTELRFKILRMLHLRPDRTIHSLLSTPISDEKPDRVANYKESTKLSSQLLSCCQRLLTDGSFVLYEENKLELTYRFRRSKSHTRKVKQYAHVHCMGGTAIAPARLSHIDHVSFDYRKWIKAYGVRNQPTRRDQDALVASGFTIEGEAGILRDWKFMQLFRHVNVKVTAHSLAHMFVAGRVLEETVRGKHIILDLDNKPAWHGSFFDACRLWRCQNIDFPGKDMSNHLRSVAEAVTSTAPVQDTLPLLKEIQHAFDRATKRFRTIWENFRLSHTGRWHSFHDYGCSYDYTQLKDIHDDMWGRVESSAMFPAWVRLRDAEHFMRVRESGSGAFEQSDYCAMLPQERYLEMKQDLLARAVADLEAAQKALQSTKEIIDAKKSWSERANVCQWQPEFR